MYAVNKATHARPRQTTVPTIIPEMCKKYFEDRKSKDKRKSKNNDLQNITQNTKDRATHYNREGKQLLLHDLQNITQNTKDRATHYNREGKQLLLHMWQPS
jgi:hypothetical protein